MDLRQGDHILFKGIIPESVLTNWW